MVEKLNKYIDHTLLRQDATEEEIKALCEEAREYDFKSVCVQPYWVKKGGSFPDWFGCACLYGRWVFRMVPIRLK